MPGTLLSFADSEVHMRYREPFLTEGLNAKLAVNQPRGIYRGFRIGTSASVLTVTITPSAENDHCAVYQTVAGLALTLRKVGGGFFQDLSAYANKTVVLAIYATYTLGADTNAELRAYELSPSDEFTGAAERPELVVLGTVVVPASGLIPAANISHDRRTMAWNNVAPEAVTWASVLRNSGFEIGEPAATHVRAFRYWTTSVAPGGGGTISPSTTDSKTGVQNLLFTYTTGTPTAVVLQPVNVPVVAGQLVRVRLSVKALKILSAGTVALVLNWRDTTSASVSTTSVPVTATGVDSVYRDIERIITVPSSPAGICTLGDVQLQLVGVNFGSSGAAIRFDQVQVEVESTSISGQFLMHERARAYEVMQDLLFEDQNAWTQDAIALRFSNGTGLVGERKDQNSAAAVQPFLDWKGTAALGKSALDTEAKALQPRLQAPYAVTVGTDFTLLWESPPISGSTLPTVRWYIQFSGFLTYTTNARWDGNQWVKDVNNVAAVKVEVNSTSWVWMHRALASNTPWLDNAWDAKRVYRPVNDSSVQNIEEAIDATGLLRFAVRPVEHAGTVEPVLQVVTSSGQRRFVLDHLGFPNQRIVTRTFWWDQPFGGDPEIGWTYLTSGANSNIITGNAAPTFGAGGCNLAVLSGTALNGFARAFYTPFLHALNNNSTINALCVISWSMRVGQQNSRKMVMGLCDSLLFTPNSTDFVGFYRLESDANWKAYTGEGANSTTTDTGVAVTDSSEHQMRIEYQGTGYPGGFATRFYIDDVLIATHNTANRQPNSSLGFLFRADNTSTFAWGSSAAFYSTVMTITLTPQDNLTGRKV